MSNINYQSEIWKRFVRCSIYIKSEDSGYEYLMSDLADYLISYDESESILYVGDRHNSTAFETKDVDIEVNVFNRNNYVIFNIFIIDGEVSFMSL